MSVLNTSNSRFKLLFAILLVVALPVFIWAVATQRIELRKRAATSEPPVVCWNRLQFQGDIVPTNISWPDGCAGNPTPMTCVLVTVPLTATERYDYQQWISAGRPWIPGCERYYPTPSPSPQPECGTCNSNANCNPGLICQSAPTPTPNCPYGSSGPCSIPAIGSYQVCVKPDGTSQCPVRQITPPPCTPLPSCATEGVIGPNGTRVFCALDQKPGVTYCPQKCVPYPTNCNAENKVVGQDGRVRCNNIDLNPNINYCPPPPCTPLPSCATYTGPEAGLCAIPQFAPGSGVWCPRPTVRPTPPPYGCYYQQVECFRAPCDPILVCPQTNCSGPNGTACSIRKCPQPYSCPEGKDCLSYKIGCVNLPGTCQNNQCIINPPTNPMACNYTINPPKICPVGYSCRYNNVPSPYIIREAQIGTDVSVAEVAAISMDKATNDYWVGRDGVCVPDYPSCGPEGSACSMGGVCPPQPTCAPGAPCPRLMIACKPTIRGTCRSGQCIPPPNPPNISNAGIMTNYNPWSVWIVATNLTTSPMKARLYDTNGSQWGSPIPVTIGSTSDYQFAGFQLPSNTPPSKCNIGKTCTISVDLVPTSGNPSNRFSFTLPSSETITCVRNTPSVTISPQTQSGNPGATLLYTANITNNDSAGCSPANFSLTTKVPSGFNGWSTMKILTIAAQHNNVASFPVTSPSNNPNAATVSVPISFTAKNPDSGLESTANAIYTYVQPVSTTVKFRFKFAGVTGSNAGAIKELVTVIFSPKNGAAYKLSPDLALTFAGDGVYEANYTIKVPLPRDTEFTMLVKGPKHGAVRFCQPTGQAAPCPYGTFMKAVGSVFDFTLRPLPAGDLNQSGKIDQADIKFVTDLLAKPSSSRKAEDIKRADVNYDGLVDIRDLNLIIQSLSVRQDE